MLFFLLFHSQNKRKENINILPNPFNSSVKIIAPKNSKLSIYDIRGKLIRKLRSNTWFPENSIVSGIYFIHIQYANQRITEKVIYLK